MMNKYCGCVVLLVKVQLDKLPFSLMTLYLLDYVYA